MYYSHYIDTIPILEKKIIQLRTDSEKLNKEIKLYSQMIDAIEDELLLLNEPPANIGTTIKKIGKKYLIEDNRNSKLLVKSELKNQIIPSNSRVALRSDTYSIFKILPPSVDPLISLMAVETNIDISYKMIGGLDEQIKEIRETIELPLKEGHLFKQLGIDEPKGVLLYGPPGTGKTLLAKAVAAETKATFFKIGGSELVQKFIGEGSRMIREIFKLAREKAPSIIFIDEIDAIGATRNDEDSEVQRTMIELLAQIDGFDSIENIKIIMATNRIDILDSALLRSGRMDKKIEIPIPSIESREEIFKIYLRKMNISKDVDFHSLALKSKKFSGADIKAVCMEAGMTAIREERSIVYMGDFEAGLRKVMSKIEKEGLVKLYV